MRYVVALTVVTLITLVSPAAAVYSSTPWGVTSAVAAMAVADTPAKPSVTARPTMRRRPRVLVNGVIALRAIGLWAMWGRASCKATGNRRLWTLDRGLCAAHGSREGRAGTGLSSSAVATAPARKISAGSRTAGAGCFFQTPPGPRGFF